MTDILNRANRLALNHLPTQTYEHSLRIAFALASDGPHAIVTALLHDVVEDSLISIETIHTQFGLVISGNVRALTRVKGEPYREYIERLYAHSKLARAVKIADIHDNMSGRETQPPSNLHKRYRQALIYLIEGHWVR